MLRTTNLSSRINKFYDLSTMYQGPKSSSVESDKFRRQLVSSCTLKYLNNKKLIVSRCSG